MYMYFTFPTTRCAKAWCIASLPYDIITRKEWMAKKKKAQ